MNEDKCVVICNGSFCGSAAPIPWHDAVELATDTAKGYLDNGKYCVVWVVSCTTNKIVYSIIKS